MLGSLRVHLLFIVVFNLLLFVVVPMSLPLVVRTVFAIPVALFFPGYALVTALFPEAARLGAMGRLLLSLALSPAIVTLIMLALNYVWALDLYPSLIGVSAFTITVSAIGWWRLRGQTGEASERPIRLLEPPGASAAGLSLRSGRLRIVLWAVLLVLSATILLFPVNITLDASPVQSLNIFANFPLFAALFLTWMGTLLFLLFWKARGGNDWEKLALVCIFALVFVDFWAIKTFYDQGGDSLSQLALIPYLQDMGRLPDIPVDYFEWPGMFLFTNFFSQATGLEPFGAAYLLRISAPVLSVALLFRIYVGSRMNVKFAAVAVLLAMVAVTGFRTSFRPDLLAYVYLFGFLVVLAKSEYGRLLRFPHVLMMMIFMAALVMTYFMHAAALFFVLLGIYVTQRLGRKKPMPFTIVLLSLIAIVAWQMYWTVASFHNMASYLPSVIDRILSFDIFSTLRGSVSSALGTEVPLWTIFTRYAKWMVLYGFGTLLALSGLVRLRRLSPQQIAAVGAVMGLGGLTVLATMLSMKGSQFYRYFMYAFAFLAPLVVGFCLNRSKGWQRNTAITLLLGFIFALSFPSLLSTGGSISVHNVSPQEVAAGEFMQERYGTGNGLDAYNNLHYAGSDIARYYIPNAVPYGPNDYTWLTNEELLFEDMDRLLREYRRSGPDSIFIFAERSSLLWYNVLRVQPDDPRWQEIKGQLAGEDNGNIIFSNDYVRIYARPTSD